MILDKMAKPVFETSKFYDCNEPVSQLEMEFPPLKSGHYTFLVEVKDLSSWKTDSTGEVVNL